MDRQQWCILGLWLTVWIGLMAAGGFALDRPWISDVFFYWYTWDYEQELGGWIGGVYNTPLVGYYDSRRYEDNYRELWLASEWGITHHFMDYWAPTWKDLEGNPREALLMRATEQLRKEGYDAFMSYYQDGEDFEMKNFVENMNPGRDVYLGLKNYAGSPAWPKLHGKPFQLVYGRNGQPELTDDEAGFREYLRQKYGTVAALNTAWESNLTSFDEARLDFSHGPPRADSIRYQYEVWQRDWGKLEEAVRQEFGFPGFLVSFDVGYVPYRGFGYSPFARVFGGPHSYGGIFGQPQDQDVERFIQSIVAKYYDTVFLDHFKNFYHDWEIRIPGTCYPPDPFHFDRFWVGDLMRYAEAILHLSWNEWWEGSNLEPCLEYGKTYCEKNLFYSTLMKLAFPSIHDYARDAQVAVLLNDYQFLVGARDQADLYETIQTLRTLTVPFDLIPDDFVTAEKLARFKLVIAPAAGLGFGQNAAGEELATLLQQWIGSGQGRRLIVTGCPQFEQLLGLQPMQVEISAAVPGPDLNVFIDVGEEGDEPFLVEGCSGRENWGKLPQDAFGATDRDLTMRWTPAQGNVTTFLLPVSAQRDHKLRLAGSALRGQRATVRVNGREVGSFEVAEGYHDDYEVPIPAAAVGAHRLIELQLVYERRIVPKEIDPERFPNETRVCNLALDWVQFSTANLPRGAAVGAGLVPARWPRERLEFDEAAPGDWAGKRLEVPYTRHGRVTHPAATVWSRYATDNAPHLLQLKPGENELLYVNGSLGGWLDPSFLETLVTQWAGVSPPHRIRGEHVRGTVLQAGNTLLALAYNEDLTTPQPTTFELNTGGRPVAEVQALSVDGQRDRTLERQATTGKAGFTDTIHYYGVYEVALSPVRLRTPWLVLHPGEERRITITLENLTDRPVTGAIRLHSIIPTLGSNLVKFDLAPRETKPYHLTLKAKPTVDWGRKTVTFKVNVGGEAAYFWRELVVERNPDLQLAAPVISTRRPELALRNAENGFSANAPARNVRVTVNETTIDFGDLPSGQEARRELPLRGTATPRVVAKTVRVRHDLWGRTVAQDLPVQVACFPRLTERPAEASPDAVARLLVANASDDYLENEVISVDLAQVALPPGVRPGSLFVREAGGSVVPSQVDSERELWCLTMLPPRTVATLWLCAGDTPPPPTDLQVEARDLGTGKGVVTLRNSRLSLTWDEARGGTATSFVSQATGKDYATGSFGLNYGQFSQYDPTKLPLNPGTFIQEKKTHQRETPGRIRLRVQGPLRAVVEVDWKDENLRARQVYELRAYADAFRLQTQIVPRAGLEAQELVAVDARFRVHQLTKIFPNFTGISEAFAEKQPQFGWRQAPYVPPVATLMTPNRFPESISFLLRRSHGLSHFRQGFWPKERPQPGTCEYAQVEYVSEPRGPNEPPRVVEADLWVQVHPGHQVVGQRFRRHLEQPPLWAVDPLPGQPQPAPGLSVSPAGPPWWNGYWHYRVRLEASAGGEALSAPLDLTPWLGEGAALDVNSLRVVELDEQGQARGAVRAWFEPATDFDAATNAAGTLVWSPTDRRARTFYLYFDSQVHGPKRPATETRSLAPTLRDGSFEEDPSLWGMDRAAVVEGEAHTGKKCGKLELPTNAGISLLSNGSMRPVPKARYRLTFWARTTMAGLAVRTNFYVDARYDFPQLGIPLTADGEWREYQTELPTGDFPVSVQPHLRLWLIDQAGTVFIDDVKVERIDEPGPATGPTVTFGEVERR